MKNRQQTYENGHQYTLFQGFPRSRYYCQPVFALPGTAVYARHLQKTRIQFAESINRSLRLISDLPRGHMDAANLPQPIRDEEIPELEPIAAAISL